MKKIWLESYPPGMPAEIGPIRYASLGDLLERSCERFGDRRAFSNMGVSISYARLERLSRDFGAWLRQTLRLVEGERVAIMLPNLLQYPVALFGALRAGLTVVNVNPLYTASELRHQLADSGATAIVVLENFARTLQEALPGTAVRAVVTTQVGDLFPPPRRWLVNLAVKYLKRLVPSFRLPGAVRFRDALVLGAAQVLGNPRAGLGDVAFLQYTGGTTGVAKGAILSHGNVIANVEQVAAWASPTLRPGEEIVVTPLPLYHVFALTANLLVFVKLGGENVLITNPRDIAGFVAELRRIPFTVITGVNTLYKALLEAPAFEAVAAASRGRLKLAVAGGMALQRSVAERWKNATGIALVEGYGLTEASPIVCGNRFDLPEFTGKLGLPLPSTEVAILGEDGAELAPGGIGEICVRGPQVMRGYWNAPQETAAAFTAERWLKTGDMGRMDERGYVEFSDRRKDVVVVSGFKAYPAEIEDVAMLHPGVKDAGAVGVPDERSGEVVALFIVRKDPSLTAEALLAHCAKHLTGYKLPRRIEFREQLPKTPIGKILRRELREEAARPHG
jgi:long-chain acyl-CoA synthetase